MNCYECHGAGRTATAVAVCHVCGAGVCGGHVHTESEQVQQPASPGKVTHDHQARKLTCPYCHGADEAF